MFEGRIREKRVDVIVVTASNNQKLLYIRSSNLRERCMIIMRPTCGPALKDCLSPMEL
jgi:hypothetical protein